MRLVGDTRGRVKLVERGLLALSPLATLERGYAIVTRREDGELIMRDDAVAAGAAIDIRLAHGALAATVASKKPD